MPPAKLNTICPFAFLGFTYFAANPRLPILHTGTFWKSLDNLSLDSRLSPSPVYSYYWHDKSWIMTDILPTINYISLKKNIIISISSIILYNVNYVYIHIYIYIWLWICIYIYDYGYIYIFPWYPQGCPPPPKYRFASFRIPALLKAGQAFAGKAPSLAMMRWSTENGDLTTINGHRISGFSH